MYIYILYIYIYIYIYTYIYIYILQRLKLVYELKICILIKYVDTEVTKCDDFIFFSIDNVS